MSETAVTFKTVYNKLFLAGSKTIGDGSTSNTFGTVTGFLVWRNSQRVWVRGGTPIQ